MPRLSREDAELALEALSFTSKAFETSNAGKSAQYKQVHQRLKQRIECNDKEKQLRIKKAYGKRSQIPPPATARADDPTKK